MQTCPFLVLRKLLSLYHLPRKGSRVEAYFLGLVHLFRPITSIILSFMYVENVRKMIFLYRNEDPLYQNK